MKKILIVMILLTLTFSLMGCKKEEEVVKVTGGWELYLDNNELMIEERILNSFNDAKKEYNDLELEYVALLEKQVVAGMNYRFLAKGYKKGEEDKTKYVIVTIYHNLEGILEITNVYDFDVTKYVNENYANPNTGEPVSGGWGLDIPAKPNELPENVQKAFDKASEKVKGITYYPIALIAKQLVSGTNYAIMCFGKTDNNIAGVYLITLYEDLNGNAEIISSAYINL